jgi:hypothetical protein
MDQHSREIKDLKPHTRKLPPLKVEEKVWIQNQAGNSPRKWDNSGLVVEVRQHNQYIIRTDGLGRVTLQNRMFLRCYMPFITRTPISIIADDMLVVPAEPTRQPPLYMADILGDIVAAWPDVASSQHTHDERIGQT